MIAGSLGRNADLSPSMRVLISKFVPAARSPHSALSAPSDNELARTTIQGDPEDKPGTPIQG